MQECIIAPLHVEHLPSAFDVARDKGLVQLAASDEGLFKKFEGRKGELEVFLFPAGPPSEEFQRGHACLRGVYLGWSTSPDTAIRPSSTKGDTPWPVYWTVRFLESAQERPHISRFFTQEGGKHSRTPRRPMIATTDL